MRRKFKMYEIKRHFEFPSAHGILSITLTVTSEREFEANMGHDIDHILIEATTLAAKAPCMLNYIITGKTFIENFDIAGTNLGPITASAMISAFGVDYYIESQFAPNTAINQRKFDDIKTTVVDAVLGIVLEAAVISANTNAVKASKDSIQGLLGIMLGGFPSSLYGDDLAQAASYPFAEDLLGSPFRFPGLGDDQFSN